MDASEMAREWLTNILGSDTDLRVCGEAHNPNQALAVLAKTAPELLVVDPGLENHNGCEVLSALRKRAACRSARICE